MYIKKKNLIPRKLRLNIFYKIFRYLDLDLSIFYKGQNLMPPFFDDDGGSLWLAYNDDNDHNKRFKGLVLCW